MLTVDEVARRLNVPVETVRRWIRQGKIPMNYSHGQYTIRNEMLERWAKDHKLEIDRRIPGAVANQEDDHVFDGVLAAMQRGGLHYNVQGIDREAVLRNAVALIPGIQTADRSRVLGSLIEREQLASTGIGNGIALPHPRSNPGITLDMPQITTCFLTTPIDFEAIDARPVSVMMILLSNTTKQHLAMLSKLSYYLRDKRFRQYLLSKSDPQSIYDQIKTLESKD